MTARDLPRRLNWGCGNDVRAGWLNSDLLACSGTDLPADIRYGLPLRESCLDYIFSSHALQMLPYAGLVPALRELRRVLRPGGVLRMGLPDFDHAIAAYQSGDAAYFYVPDADAMTVGGKLSVQLTWYGSSLTLLNFEYTRELLYRAGFADVRASSFGSTSSEFAEIVALDNRERESFFVEAWK
jgi:predicted SAM-dependent methyltransferase